MAAVGASATAGLTSTDAQRLKMVISGMGPSAHPAVPLPAAVPAEGAEAAAVGGGDGGDGDGAKDEPGPEDDATAGDAMEGVEAPADEAMEE